MNTPDKSEEIASHIQRLIFSY